MGRQDIREEGGKGTADFKDGAEAVRRGIRGDNDGEASTEVGFKGETRRISP